MSMGCSTGGVVPPRPPLAAMACCSGMRHALRTPTFWCERPISPVRWPHSSAFLAPGPGIAWTAAGAVCSAAFGRRLACSKRRPFVKMFMSHSEVVARSSTSTSDADLCKHGQWCALVINLARREDRLSHMQQLLLHTNPRLWQRLERIDAVDGKTLNLEDAELSEIVMPHTLERALRAKEKGIYTVVHDDNNVLVHFDDHLTEGAVACILSHRKALERVASHPTAEWGLILEDDVSVVVPEVDHAIMRILDQLPADWMAVYLGYHHDDGQAHPQGLRIGSQLPVADDIVEVPVGGVYDNCWGLFSWVVRKETAQVLLDNLFPIDSQIDGAISHWLVRNYGPGRVFKVPPEELLFYSACSEEAQDSDIQTMALRDAVEEEYGSWGAYLQNLKMPNPYESWLLEELYGRFDEDMLNESPDWVPEDEERSYGCLREDEDFDSSDM